MIVYRNFDGDVRQAIAGVAAAHGVTFKEATTVFSAEDLAISEDRATGELRAVGTSNRGRKLVVLHQRGQRIRILHIALDGVPESENEAWNVANAGAREAPGIAADAAPPSSATGAMIDASRVERDGAPSERGADSIVAARAAAAGGRSPDAARTAEPSKMVRLERPTVSASSAPSSSFGSATSAASSSFGSATSAVRRGPGRPRRSPPAAPAASASEQLTMFAQVASAPSPPAVRASHDPPKRPEPEAIVAPAPQAASKHREPEAVAAPEAKSKRREPEAMAALAPQAPPKQREPATRAASEPPPASAVAPADAAAASASPAPTNGWTAEAYDIYWTAYSTARDEARRQGKSTREAQLLGRAAGELASSAHSQPAAKPRPAPAQKERRPAVEVAAPEPHVSAGAVTKRSSRGSSWRAAARAVKLDG